MYWIMIKRTEATVATTYVLEYAEWIVANFPEECIIRYVTNK